MSTVNTSTTSDEIRQASFAGPSSIAPADSTVNDAALRAALTRVNEENAGMTDELLRCYGQLHLVFGVAKKAADLRDAEAVAVTLLRDLGALLELEQAWFLPEPDEPANTDSVTDSGNIVPVYLTRNAEDLGLIQHTFTCGGVRHRELGRPLHNRVEFLAGQRPGLAVVHHSYAKTPRR